MDGLAADQAGLPGTGALSSMIPRIIHQVWLGGDFPQPPDHFVAASDSWGRTHPEWEYRLWTGPEVESLFASARPDLLEIYRGLRYWVQKADAARYLILYEHGGVYADFDIVSLRSLEDLADNEAVLAPTKPLGISNDLMMAESRHALFKAVLDEIPSSLRRWHRPWIPRHFRIMCGLGSLHLTRVFAHSSEERGVRLLTEREYGHGDPELALVRHIDGNTWARWDTHVFIFFGNHWKKLLLGAGGLAASWALISR